MLNKKLRTYGSYERGERDISTAVLLNICTTLKISLDYLLGRNESRNVEEYDDKDTLCIKVSGDSMYPKIEDGDLIVVRKQKTVDNGQIAVVLVDGDEGYVKKIFCEKESISLVSINPEYKDKIFEKEDMNRVDILGLVQQVIKTL